jgi:hypothetical protein
VNVNTLRDLSYSDGVSFCAVPDLIARSEQSNIQQRSDGAAAARICILSSAVAVTFLGRGTVARMTKSLRFADL